jgi:hypothetical protein
VRVNVDTADLGNLAAAVAGLAEQVAAQGRKISHLSGRTTILSAVVGRLDRGVEALAGATELGQIMARAGMPSRPAPRHARPRHLRVVGRGTGTSHH